MYRDVVLNVNKIVYYGEKYSCILCRKVNSEFF